jgi:hypothetical protein
MAKHRSLDSDFWHDPKMRRLPWHARTLFAALVTDVADDEGRFAVDTYGLLDTLFARQDPVSESDIADDLQLLSESGLVRLYDEGRHGFVRSWYKRQIIGKPNRDPSSLPEPPCDELTPITCWEMLDALVPAYPMREGQKKTWNTLVAAWFSALDPEVQAKLREVNYFRLLLSKVTSRARTHPTPEEGKEKAEDGPPEPDAKDDREAPPVPPTEPEPDEPPPSGIPANIGMLKCNHPNLSTAVHAAFKDHVLAKCRDEWFAFLCQTITDWPSVTEDRLVETLKTNRPKGTERWPDAWVKRNFPETDARASPPRNPAVIAQVSETRESGIL